MAIYALLVGVNSYLNDSIRNLNGCKNDVALMKETLLSRYAITEANILTLTSREATKDNIVDGFKTHLAQASEKDSVLFYFSGHGSQEPAAEAFWSIDPDRQLETLVCHDSRAGNVTDLSNKELRYLIANINKQAEVIVIIDSCHSGNASRTTNSGATRQTSSQRAPRKLEDFVFYDDAVQQGWINDLASIPQRQHIILSACRDIELSREKKIGNEVYGIFTHSICTLLNKLPTSLSYHNLLMRARAITHKQNTLQTPQVDAILNADTSKMFLGQSIQPLSIFTSYKNGHWELDAGLIHSINKGDQIALKNNSNDIILIAEVSEASAGISILKESNHRQKTPLQRLSELDQDESYESTVSHQHIKKLRFSIEGDVHGFTSLRNAIETLDNNTSSKFIEEVASDSINAEYHVRAQDGQYTIGDANSDKFRPLFEAVTGINHNYDDASAEEVLKQLEHLKRWQQKLELENSCEGINMDAVELVVKHNDKEIIDSDVQLRYDYSKPKPKPRISIELRCNPEKAKDNVALYCALLLFDAADSSVSSLLSNEAKLLPPNSLNLHFMEGKTFPVQVKDVLFNKGISETKDFLKLIVSDKPFDSKLLDQKGLEIFKGENKSVDDHNRGVNQSLYNLLDQELNFAHTRSFELDEEPVIPQWFTKTVKVRTSRPLQAVNINPNTATVISDGVRLEAHPQLRATINLSTMEEATRSLDNQQNHNIVPPIFRDETLTPPLSFSTTREASTDLNIIEIQFDSTKDANAGGIDSVNADQPLIITLDQDYQDNETVLPYAFDGEFYLPLGSSQASDSNQTQIIIERLPDANTESEGDEADKSLFGSIKIMFQRILHDKFGLVQDPTRIAIPQFENPDDPRDVTSYMDGRKTLKKKIEESDKILLVIHGIIGSTNSMAGFTQAQGKDGKALKDHYDCILSFDYENLNQPIQKTAEILREKLIEIGLKEDHGKQLDVVVHSMGGLVSRCFIEFNHGDKIVNKLVMLGTPNAGSEIANAIGTGINFVGDWANNTLAAIINGYLTNGMGTLAIASLVKFLKAGSKTLGQMNPDSDLLQMLEKSKQTTVPYYIIAGNTDFLVADAKTDVAASFMQRMTQKLKLLSYQQLTHWLYKDPNDIAATVQSVGHLPADWTEKTEVRITDCNHLCYFAHDEVATMLEEILLD